MPSPRYIRPESGAAAAPLLGKGPPDRPVLGGSAVVWAAEVLVLGSAYLAFRKAAPLQASLKLHAWSFYGLRAAAPTQKHQSKACYPSTARHRFGSTSPVGGGFSTS